GVENQQGFLQAFGGDRRQFGVVEQLNEGADIVATQHCAEQFGGLRGANEGTGFLAQRDGGQIGGLDHGGFIYASGNAVREQIKQECFFASRRRFDEFNEFCRLLGGKR